MYPVPGPVSGYRKKLIPVKPSEPAPLPPIPANEAGRLAALESYQIMDVPPEADFDQIVQLAAQLCKTPIALISLLDQRRQWFLANVGIPVRETPRSMAFCAYTIMGNELMQVENALQDSRFARNPLVTGAPDIRFYAGIPLVTSDGYALGSLCVIDQKPRKLNRDQVFGLQVLARQVVQQLELRRNLRAHREAEGKLKAILDSVTDFHLLLSADYRVLSFNKKLQQYIEQVHHRSIQLGDDFREYTGQGWDEQFKAHFNRALSGEQVSVETQFYRSATHSPWHLTRYFPATDDNGSIIAVAINAKDIDQRKRTAHLIHTQKERLLEIAHLQSHKIRGPLATILGLLQLVNPQGLSLENRKYFKLLKSSADKLDQTVHEIVYKTHQVRELE